jgi:hypothetical protein
MLKIIKKSNFDIIKDIYSCDLAYADILLNTLPKFNEIAAVSKITNIDAYRKKTLFKFIFKIRVICLSGKLVNAKDLSLE